MDTTEIINRINEERKAQGLSYAKLGALINPPIKKQQVYQILTFKDVVSLEMLDRLLLPLGLERETTHKIKKVKKSKETLAS